MQTEEQLRYRGREFYHQRREWYVDRGAFADRRIFWSDAEKGLADDLRRLPCQRLGDEWEHVRYLVECELSMHGSAARRNPWIHPSEKRSSSAVLGFEVLDGSVGDRGEWKITKTRELRAQDVVSPGSHLLVKVVHKPRNYPTFVPGRFRVDVHRAWEDVRQIEWARNHMDVVLAFENTGHASQEQIDHARSAVVVLEDDYNTAFSRASDICPLSGTALLVPSPLSKWPHVCDLEVDPDTGMTIVPPDYQCTGCQGIGKHLPSECPECQLPAARPAPAAPAPAPAPAEAPAAAPAAAPVEPPLPSLDDEDLTGDLFSPSNAPASWL